MKNLSIQFSFIFFLAIIRRLIGKSICYRLIAISNGFINRNKIDLCSSSRDFSNHI